MPAVPFPTQDFIKALTGLFRGVVGRLLSNAGNDLAKDGFANQLLTMTADAIASGDEERVELLKAGVPWLLTFYKFRVTNETNDAFKSLIGIVTGVASVFLGGLIPVVNPVTPTTERTDPLL